MNLLKILFCLLSIAGFAFSTNASEFAESRDLVIRSLEFNKKLRQRNDWSRALQHAQTNYQYARKSLHFSDALLIKTAQIYTNALNRANARDEALVVLEDLVAYVEETSGENSRMMIEALSLLGNMRPRETSASTLMRAIEIHERNFPDDHESYARLARTIGFLLSFDPNNRDDALRLLHVALPFHKEKYGDYHGSLYMIYMGLGAAYVVHDEEALAVEYYSKAIRIAEIKGLGGFQANLMIQAGERLADMSTSLIGRQYLQDALSMHETLYGSDHIDTARARNVLGRIYLKSGEPQYAVDQLLQANAFFAKHANLARLRIKSLKRLVEAYEAMGLRDKASVYCRQIGRLVPFTTLENYDPLFAHTPDYPAEALQEQIEGYAVVEFTVDKNGFIRSPKVVEARGHTSFEKVSLAKVLELRYAPRFIGGEAIDTPGVRYRYDFNINTPSASAQD